MESKKVNKKAIAEAATRRQASDVQQQQAQRISPAIQKGGQFTASSTPTSQSASALFPGQYNAAEQGINDLYAITKDDWFWRNWQANAAKNNMTGGGQGNGYTESGSLPKLGKVFVPEQFWDYAKKKQEQAFQEDFNRFVFSQVDVTTPQGRAYWEKKHPEYTQKVYQAYATKMQIEAKMAEIQIKGFHTEGDLWFAYMYQNKYFDRMLTPPSTRLTPISADQPQTVLTSIASDPLTTSMPNIPS
jgi:hypothetical protein